MAQRYISNNLPAQSLGSDPKELLTYALELVVRHAPPRKVYHERHLGGLFTGYTGLAYLFLQLSELYPDLQISGQKLISWAQRYLEGDRGKLVLEKGNCGISSEKLSFQAVRACVTKDEDHLIEFLGSMPILLGPYTSPQEDAFPSEIPYGRAGALYLLRMVRHWMPRSETLIESPLRRLTERIMSTDDDGRGNWEWHGKRYFGAAHGDIGIITQVVLSNPSLAPQLTRRLEKLLELQLPDGNWPSSVRSLKEGKSASLIQWCHGAPGFLYSLQSLRPYFPELQSRIDSAIEKGESITWRHGLLTKEPSLCHGIFGNALVLPQGAKRQHFLALATANAVEKVRRHDPDLFEPASYGHKAAVLMNYLPSAAWTWAVCEQEHPRLIMYNDV
ncbi:3 like [Fusarium sporotrichioides]|uniref:3 like n=1 Tax=Fusarium sporotrichioides TaxID=5514 RepID=A0A395S621_FUSSP|nr:3 like [Fusarium sporotrichioides]